MQSLSRKDRQEECKALMTFSVLTSALPNQPKGPWVGHKSASGCSWLLGFRKSLCAVRSLGWKSLS